MIAPRGGPTKYAGSGVCRQLRLLLWKNWIIKKNKWVDTLIEILAPVLFGLILIGLRKLIAITPIQESHPCCGGTGTEPSYARNLAHSLVSLPPTFPFADAPPLLYWACGGTIRITGGGGGDPTPSYSLRIAVSMRTQEQTNAYRNLRDDLVFTLQNNMNTMANAMTLGFSRLGLSIQKFCPTGGSLHNKTLQDWVGKIVRTFDSYDDLQKFILSPTYAGFGGVPLADPATPGDDTPIGMAVILDAPSPNFQTWSYDIRFNQSRARSTDTTTNVFDRDYSDGSWSQYISAGFSGMQMLVDQWIISKATNTPFPNYTYAPTGLPPSASSPPITLVTDRNLIAAPMPIAKHDSDNFGTAVGSLLGLFLILAWSWPFSRLVRNMVEEKENRIKEGLKMMGLSNIVFWLSWAITYAVMLLITSIILTAILSRGLFDVLSPALVFFVFLFFSFATIALAIFVSAFFSKAKTAGVLSLFFLIAIFIPYFAVSGADYSVNAKNGASISAPIAFSLGLSQMLLYQSNFTPINAGNLNEIYQNYSMGACVGLLIFDIFLYLILAWYADNVIPQEYGTTLPWYFPFTKAYWLSFCDIYEADGELDPLIADADRVNLDNIESVTAELAARPNIAIKNLRKEFPGHVPGQPHVAVKGLNMSIYEGQIFVLLGHNGAGKTTTINMLTGMLSPTRGGANVLGLDLVSQLPEIRRMFGVCPQHDILFPTLTVKEHLELFAALKGVPSDEIDAMVKASVDEVQLTAEAGLGQEALSMSGGQRRRLCLAIALIADSKVVFLDEPTSGVDPFSRRAIWDLLTKKKQERIIILTTHFMDEADQLGDRIAIMHHGGLRCLGTPLFLKSKFGVGYNIVMSKTPNCDPQTVTALVKQHVPQADLLSSVGTELAFRLPIDSSAQFPGMLRQIDGQRAQLGIENYGISVTTMEEVFLKVARDDDKPKPKPSTSSSSASVTVHGDDADEKKETDSLQPKAAIDASKLAANIDQQTFSRHFTALMIKRWNYSKRDERAICCSLIVPLVILAFGLGILRIPTQFSYPRLTLGPQLYNQPFYMPLNDKIGDASGVSAPSVGPAITSAYNTYPSSMFQTEVWDTSAITTPLMAYSIINTTTNATSTLYPSVPSMLAFSKLLLQNRNQHKQTRYGALMFDKTLNNAVQFTNQTGLQTVPVMTNMYTNYLLRNLTGNPSASITTSINLFEWTQSQQNFIQSINGIFAAIIIAIAFCFVPAAYAVFVVKERESKAKHLQMISGVGIVPFWLANFAWDMIQYSIVASIAALIILAFNNPVYVGENYGVIWVNFFMFGLSVIPFTYCFSFLFSSHSTAQNVMIMIYLIGGLALTIVSIVLYQFESTRDANDKVLRYIFRLSPNFCVCDTFFYLGLRTFLRVGPWDLRVCGYNLIFMAWETVAYSIIAIGIEWFLARSSLVGAVSGNAQPNELSTILKQLADQEQEDSDVAAERRNMKANVGSDDLIRLQGLRKVYGTGKVAVEDLWFSIPKNQCFGFLGVNGAGKSTALKILTGDELPTEGSAFLGGHNIATEPALVRRLMGYCPQFDAIHDLLTAQEHLEFYGRIRGVPEENLQEMVSLLTKRLTLDQDDQHLRPAGTYSGGNKRKLSVAIALIGNPPVVFLDEPSTGMDPVSRRFMWDFLSETMANRAVILTTHSMEECEALCQRIGILVLGRLKCLGSSQHLKSKYGHGFQIDMTLSDESKVEGVRAFLKQKFAGAEEIECFGGSVKYSIGAQNMSLADIFETMEGQKGALSIANYAISQTSLEQIFISFARTGDNYLQEAERQLRARGIEIKVDEGASASAVN